MVRSWDTFAIDDAFFAIGAAEARENETGAAYNRAAAELAWNRTMTFFGTHLK